MTNPTWLYVAAIYAAAVWLARRAGVALPRRIALFFYAIVLFFCWLPLTRDYVSFPVDGLRGMPPWTYLTNDHTSANGELNDLFLQIVPWAHEVRESWKSLTVPLWNASASSGYPLLANGQSSALSPLRILTLPLSLGHAMSAEAAMKLLIAMTFLFLHCRRRYSELASVVAAVTFGLSGFIVGWLHFPIATVACFAPAVLYAIDLLAERRTHGRFVFAALLGAVIVFGGHPETAAHLFLLAVLYVAWLLFAERPAGLDRRRFAGVLAAAVVAGALLAMPYLAPVAEAFPRSARHRALQRAPFTRVLSYADWQSAIVVLQPHFFGQVPRERPWGPGETEPLGGYAGVFGAIAWVAMLAHVISRRAWRSREMFYVLMTLIAWGVMMNWPLLSHGLHALLPMMAHARVRLVLVLLLAIQTAAAIDLARRVPLLLGALAVSAALCVLAYAVPFPSVSWHDTALLAMMPSLAVAIAATLVAVTRRDRAVLALLVAVIAELSIVGRDRNPSIDGALLYPKTPLIRALETLQKQQPPNAPFRIAGAGAMLYPNTAAIYGFEDIRFHDPMANQRYSDFMVRTADYDITKYFPWWEKGVESRSTDYLNVRYVLALLGTQPPDPRRFRRVYDGPDGVIYENRDVLPRFYAVRNVIIQFNDELFDRKLWEMEEWSHTALLEELKLESRQMHDDFFHPRPEGSPLAKATIVAAKPTDYQLHVTAPRYSLVVSSVPWWPGWKVERNGKHIDPIRVNGAFVGFAVPPGESDVRVWFAPWTFWGGVIVALLTLLALIGVRWQSHRFGIARSAAPPHTRAVASPPHS